MTSDTMGKFATDIYQAKYAHTKDDGTKETWPEVAQRVAFDVLTAVRAATGLKYDVCAAISRRELMPGGRYLYATGRPFHQTNNCFLFRAEDSREGWANLLHDATMSLMTGGGIGGFYSSIREKDAPIRKTGGVSSGPIALMQMMNEVGRHVQQGGARRAAIWAGLSWWHPDIDDFILLKNWSPEVRALKEKDFDFPATMDKTNISVCLDDDFFKAIGNEKHEKHEWAKEVYWTTIRRMMKTGEPGFSVDTGDNFDENLRNACTEITSEDDGDVCNLVHVNLSKMRNIGHFRNTVRMATRFAVAGTVYSDVPFDRVKEVRAKNRRLGVGLMGVHEWLLQRGKPYAPDEELAQWLDVYVEETTETAEQFALDLGLSVPVKTRAIAPTGTTGIVAETSTGIEPIYCAAFKRRYVADGNTWKYQYVVDPTARRIIERHGLNPEDIEYAYSIKPRARVEFQAWFQQYVDHGISSTINLPAWGTIHNNEACVDRFGEMLLKHLPDLRGITCYPDGARGGQPLTPIPYAEALKHEGEVFEESIDICDLTGGGSCGD